MAGKVSSQQHCTSSTKRSSIKHPTSQAGGGSGRWWQRQYSLPPYCRW